MAIQVADNFSYQGAKPLDARLKYNTVADMVAVGASTIYDGILAYVVATKTYYTYDSTNDVDVTLGKWRELETGGGAENIVEGYFNEADDLFYEESTFVTPIAGAPKVIYIDLVNNWTYRYEDPIFLRLDEEVSNDVIDGYYYNGEFYGNSAHTAQIPHRYNRIYIDVPTNKIYRYTGVTDGYVCINEGQITQVTTLPTADVSSAGKIYQYVGTTGAYTFGYFYACVEDTDNPGTYLWEQINVQPDNDTQIQVETIPTASSTLEDKIVQYVGVTDSTYTNGFFYKCIEDSENPGTYIWEAVSVQEGGSGSGSLSKAITAAIEVGGIDVGDNFAIGTSYDDMWDALLNPTLYPTFTNPSASLSYSADTYYEVGTSIAAKTATASLNRGAITPAYGTSGYRSGAATNYAIATSGADTEYSDSSTSSGSFSVPALTRATKGNIVLTATVSYAAGEQPKDSKGNNYDSPLAAGSKTASKTMQFIQPYYYGKSSTSTVSSFTGLTKSVTAKGQKQFKFTTNNEYMVIAYDSSYGNLSSIIDPNGFETISGWTKSTLTVGGFSYYVYVANSATTDTNAQFTFKY